MSAPNMRCDACSRPYNRFDPRAARWTLADRLALCPSCARRPTATTAAPASPEFIAKCRAQMRAAREERADERAALLDRLAAAAGDMLPGINAGWLARYGHPVTETTDLPALAQYVAYVERCQTGEREA